MNEAISNGVKILYIITQADGGGAQKYVLSLAKHFNGAIAAGSEASGLFDEARLTNLQTYPLTHLKRNITPWHDLLAIWEIRELIKSYNPDIVHLNSSKAGVLGSFAAMGLKKKVVFTAHGFIFNEPLSWPVKTFYLALEKVASDYRDFIITVSNADRESALKNNLIAPDKIKTIYNGIGPIIFLSRDEARTALNLSTDKTIIGCVANFYKTKGVDILIEAIALIEKPLQDSIQVALIGDGTENTNLKALSYKLKTPVKFLGKINDAQRYLKAFDIFVLPSRKEGFPFALLEGMQGELPIIATNVGGNPEGLFTAGRLIDPSSPEQIAQAIKELIADKSIIIDLSKKAAERSKLFTETKMLGETQKVYEKLLE